MILSYQKLSLLSLIIIISLAYFLTEVVYLIVETNKRIFMIPNYMKFKIQYPEIKFLWGIVILIDRHTIYSYMQQWHSELVVTKMIRPATLKIFTIFPLTLKVCQSLELKCWLSKHQLVDHGVVKNAIFKPSHMGKSCRYVFLFFLYRLSLCRHYYKIDNASAIFNNRDNVSVHWELINVCV